MSQGRKDKLLSGVTGTVTGPSCAIKSDNGAGFVGAVQGSVAGTGTVTATITIYVSNSGNTGEWILAGTITLSGTTTATDGFAISAPWQYFQANVTAISGTNATVNVILGY